MTRHAIKRLAIQCGWVLHDNIPYEDQQAVQAAFLDRMDKLATAVVLAEREACAKLCEELRHPNYSAEGDEWLEGTTMCAVAIRARSEMPSPPPNPTACGESQ